MVNSSESLKSEHGREHCQSEAIESCKGAITVRRLVVVEIRIVAENDLRIALLRLLLLVALCAGVPRFAGEGRAAHIIIGGGLSIACDVVKILVVAIRVIAASVLELDDVQVCEGFESLNAANHDSCHRKFYEVRNLHFNRFVLQFYLKLINSRKSLEN